MRSDCDAVGGFAEDLPVLAIIISGVVLLMTTANWVGDMLISAEISRTLDEDAQEIADRFALLLTSQSDDDLPLIESIREGSNNLSLLPADEINYIITVTECYPEWMVLRSFECSISGSPCVETAFAIRYINALDRYDRVATLEVRVLAW